MHRTAFLLTFLLLLAPASPVLAVEPFLTLPEAASPSARPELPALNAGHLQATAPMHMDSVLAREHERFAQFATAQVQRMNATMLGGRNSMQVHKVGRLYRATYKAIDEDTLVCQVRRSDSNPNYFVGSVLYKEFVLESVGQTAEACRRGTFEPVSEKSSRIIYSSKHGGGWN
ncbi:MAG: hypothetical protein KKA55_11955 [Proteobacteria bacterium]|nr:hypothetical protein [Pseudomonadota bacterium]MBU1596231.1 hypothetical protein [Pseudomonadota bacterium]